VTTSHVELDIDDVAVGGDGVGRTAGGKVVFVGSTMPGDRVRVALIKERKRHAHGRLVEVLEPSSARREVTCDAHRAGCGGCAWLGFEIEAQRAAKRAMVPQALERIGRLTPELTEGIDLGWGAELAPVGFRTQLRCGVEGDRLAFKEGASHRLVEAGSCQVAHPGLVEVLESGRFPQTGEAVLRHGAVTGETLVVLDRGAEQATVPEGVRVVNRREAVAASYTEVIEGHRFRVSAGSFFQTRSDGATALVREVSDMIGGRPRRLLDVGCGVGLFSVTISAEQMTVGVERNAASAADARHNLTLAAAGGGGRTVPEFEPRADMSRQVQARSGSAREWAVHEVDLDDWTPTDNDVVVADPARAGLGRAGVAAMVGSRPDRIVLVSCDVGAFGRDTGLLVESGWVPTRIRLLDLFPQTPHVEIITRFDPLDAVTRRGE